MNNPFDALPAYITDEIERMQYDADVKKIHVVVLSNIELELAHMAFLFAAEEFAKKDFVFPTEDLRRLAARFTDQPDDELEAVDPNKPLTQTRW